MKITIPKIRISTTWLSLLVGLFFLVLLFTNFRTNIFQHFVIEADSILNGQLSFLKLDGYGKDVDMVLREGKYYWALGPAPTLLILPWVFLAKGLGFATFTQGYVQFILIALTFWLIYRITRKFKFNVNDSLMLVFAFCFASTYAAVAYYAQSWYFSQVVAVFGVVLALHEYYLGRRHWLIGIGVGLALATRMTAGFSIIFFLAMLLTNRELVHREKVKALLQLLAPFGLAILLILLVNYLKFGDIFDNGYTSALIKPDTFAKIRSDYGLFSISHIMSNFYWYFLKGPDAVVLADTYHLINPYLKIDWRGLSFFFVAPLFARLLLPSLWRNNLTKEKLALLGSSLVILLVLLSYFASGYVQYGPRYLNDLMPLWYMLLLFSFPNRKVSKLIYVVIIASAFINLYFMVQMFGYSN